MFLGESFGNPDNGDGIQACGIREQLPEMRMIGALKLVFNQNPIVFEEHQNWYLKKIAQPDCIYLLGKWENNIVGSLRFDITNNTALISYLVSPKYHGKGFGRIILAKGLDYLATHTANITIANGYVLPQNIASIKVFERLAFDCTTENNQLLFSKKINR